MLEAAFRARSLLEYPTLEYERPLLEEPSPKMYAFGTLDKEKKNPMY